MSSEEFPEAAFESINLSEDKKYELKYIDASEVDDSSLNARLKLSQVELIDMSLEGGKFFELVESKEANITGYRGLKAKSCYREFKNSYSKECEERTEFNPQSTEQTVAWLHLLSQTVNKEDLFRDEEKLEDFNRWTERAQYYDSRLEPGEFFWKPLEIVIYQEESGLHVIGEEVQEIRINGETYEVESQENWSYLEKDLEPGKHLIEMEEDAVNLTVYPPAPDTSILNDELRIQRIQGLELENSFDKVVVRNSEGSVFKKTDLKKDSETVADIGGMDKEESFELKFVSESVNLTREENLSKDSEDEEIKVLKRAFGIDRESYENVYTLVSLYEKAPFSGYIMPEQDFL